MGIQFQFYDIELDCGEVSMITLEVVFFSGYMLDVCKVCVGILPSWFVMWIQFQFYDVELGCGEVSMTTLEGFFLIKPSMYFLMEDTFNVGKTPIKYSFIGSLC